MAAPTNRGNYPALVEFWSQHPSEISFLRLRELNVRNLLFYQSQLLFLERELGILEDQDARQNPKLEDRLTRRWNPSMAKRAESMLSQQPQATVAGSHTQADPNNQAQISQSGAAPHPATSPLQEYCDKVIEIRETLAKYNEALAHFLQQERMPSPHERVIRYQNEWLRGGAYGNSFLAGTTADAWKPDSEGRFHPDAFMTMTPSEGPVFQIARILMAIKVRIPWNQSSARVFRIDSSSQGELAQGLFTVISCVVPVLPIVVLYVVNSLSVRIGLILVFTAVYAVVLVFGLKLEPEKVITITLALAAVQVVFVGSTSHALAS